MKTIQFSIVFIFVFSVSSVKAQQIALTIADSERKGLSISHLDSTYKSAVHADTSLSVFKTETEQQAMGEAYMKLLQDFGKFLTANEFRWERPTRAFNRIYFNADGSIDYFLYNFISPGDEFSQQKQDEFNRLLNNFVKEYKIALTAKTKFAQCSGAIYSPKELK